MLKNYRLKVVLLCIVIGSGWMFASFSENSNHNYYSLNSSSFDSYLFEFKKSLEDLDQKARDFKDSKLILDSLQAQVLNTRLAYKKIEFYLAFHHNDFVNSNINGAPLLKIERTSTVPVVLPPVGLQLLDELVFSQNPTESKGEISYTSTKLVNSYNALYNKLKLNENYNILNPNALRLEIVRIFTLGLTGFDTPGSLNAIPEAVSALSAILTLLQENNSTSSDSEIILLRGAIALLQDSKSFEDFDRLAFLKDYLDPLYKELGKMKLNNTSTSNNLGLVSAWNPESTSIFANDFLNPYFFTQIEKEEDNANVRSLGKQLFYDPILSNQNAISCATCHDPNRAFTDNQKKSMSNIQGKTVLRNAPTLINSVYADRYFYDLRAFTLEQQVEHVIFNSEEFNTTYLDVLEKINLEKTYKPLITKAFGETKLTRARFTKALASYVLSLRSYNSEFDTYVRSETKTIAPSVKKGFNLFMGKANCATCHFAPTFAGLVPPFYNESESEILGVLENPNAQQPVLDHDEGRYANAIESEKAWIYQKSFKTTTVRNSSLTAPYFHNGAYESLEEVMEFYNNGGGEGLGLSVSNQTLASNALNLTENEKTDIIAFLNALEDVPIEHTSN